MTRLTRYDAALVARDLQATVARLTTVVDQKPHGRNAAAYDEHRKQLGNGYRHELETLERLAARLAEGLQVPHFAPEVAGPTDTSAAALAAALPKASGNRAKVLNALVLEHRVWANHDGVWHARQGLTDVRISRRTGLAPNTVRPRRGELVAQGWVEDSGERRDHNGRSHIVWRLTDAARERLQTGDTAT